MGSPLWTIGIVRMPCAMIRMGDGMIAIPCPDRASDTIVCGDALSRMMRGFVFDKLQAAPNH